MTANNTEGLTAFEINLLVQQGGKFVQFPYTSGLIKKIKNSNIYFVRPEEHIFKYAWKHFFSNLNLSLQTAFPNTPIYMLKSLYLLAQGGKDYTFTMLEKLNRTNFVYNSNLYDLYDLNSLQEL
ncbi:hypothetical protein [Flavobacterium daemonense]|uniref:hypothetical protein n=1 Tax=Flavobacterium daemonense TaxID=1393049 RepID=UPI001184C932|nr:hypothetical protein [Flavobacterium daemonense]KAF2335074.1 hypothetical protein FND99_07615 [Flavobacterium daemonense]